MSRKEHALINILESIAAEKKALAKIINAETDIVRLFIQTAPHLQPMLTVDNLIEFNTSVNRLLLIMPTLELILQNKLDVASTVLDSFQHEQEEDTMDDTDEE